MSIGTHFSWGRGICVLLLLSLVACGWVQGGKASDSPWAMSNPEPPSPTPTLSPTPQVSYMPLVLSGEPADASAAPEVLLSPTPVDAAPSPTTTPSPEPSPTPLPTATPTPEPTPTPTPSPTPILEMVPDGTSREILVPILMYHRIEVPPPDADAIRRDLSVYPENLEAQLQYLEQEGYQSVHLSDLVFYLQTGGPLPPKPIVITFDDGYRDAFTQAFPLLSKYGFTATFFIITRLVDEGREEYLSWDQVKALHDAGMEIGSHSYSHPNMGNRSHDYIVWQVLGSKEAIETRIGEPVRFFSYPSGSYDQAVEDVLKELSFWGAVTIRAGALQSSDLVFEMPRVRVRGAYGLWRFQFWLNYWLANSE